MIGTLPRHPLALALGGALLLTATPVVLAQTLAAPAADSPASLRLPTLHVQDSTAAG